MSQTEEYMDASGVRQDADHERWMAEAQAMVSASFAWLIVAVVVPFLWEKLIFYSSIFIYFMLFYS